MNSKEVLRLVVCERLNEFKEAFLRFLQIPLEREHDPPMQHGIKTQGSSQAFSARDDQILTLHVYAVDLAYLCKVFGVQACVFEHWKQILKPYRWSGIVVHERPRGDRYGDSRELGPDGCLEV